jgi:hypothetical protein
MWWFWFTTKHIQSPLEGVREYQLHQCDPPFDVSTIFDSYFDFKEHIELDPDHAQNHLE